MHLGWLNLRWNASIGWFEQFGLACYKNNINVMKLLQCIINCNNFGACHFKSEDSYWYISLWKVLAHELTGSTDDRRLNASQMLVRKDHSIFILNWCVSRILKTFRLTERCRREVWTSLQRWDKISVNSLIYAHVETMTECNEPARESCINLPQPPLVYNAYSLSRYCMTTYADIYLNKATF